MRPNKNAKSMFPVCVIGLGTVGFPTAQHISKYGEVWGYDIKKIKNSAIPVTSDWNEIPSNVKTFIICVNTNFHDGHPDMSSTLEMCKRIKDDNRHGLVSIESTVLPGTCRRISSEVLVNNSNFMLVHVPHRYWSGDPENYGVRQLRVLGGIDEISKTAGIRFYEEIGIPTFPVSKIEVAELSKVAENSYRFIEISYAEYLSLLCKQMKISFNKVREACNTLKRNSPKEQYRIQMLEARSGIGGECLPKDIRYLLALMDSPLLQGAIQTDAQFKKKVETREHEGTF